MNNDTLTAIAGIRVGHAALPGGMSGCTVVMADGGAEAGVDVRGGAPSTLGADSLNPVNLIRTVHALFFSGGSAFGLSVADGVRRFLAERGRGFDTGCGVVPIVAGAVIFDLNVNDSDRRPDAALGYEACLSASSGPVEEGSVGAGAGATVGKIYGSARGMKAGLGSACIQAESGVSVGALMVVNAIGNVVDPASGKHLAGCRRAPDSPEILDAELEMERMRQLQGFPQQQATVVGCVAANVRLSKTQLTKVAQMAHDGLARTIHPIHTIHDGDAIFALSCGKMEDVDVSIVGSLAARATALAVLRGVRKARSQGALPSCMDLSNRTT